MLKLVHTIKKEDIGKVFIKIIIKGCPYCETKDREEHIYLYNFMGYILSLDVGKRIYRRKNNYCVENDEQLQKRLLAIS